MEKGKPAPQVVSLCVSEEKAGEGTALPWNGTGPGAGARACRTDRTEEASCGNTPAPDPRQIRSAKENICLANVSGEGLLFKTLTGSLGL